MRVTPECGHSWGTGRGDVSITIAQFAHRTRSDEQAHQPAAKSGGASVSTTSSVRRRKRMVAILLPREWAPPRESASSLPGLWLLHDFEC